MAHDVFISHSSKDKVIADAMCAALEQARIRCWMAPRDVLPGRAFSGQIKRAIEGCRVMVLVFSSHSNDSEEVLREVQLAARMRCHIVNFRLEDVSVSDDLDYYLTVPHWLDAVTPPIEQHGQQLVRSVQMLLDLEKSQEAMAAELDRPTGVSAMPSFHMQDPGGLTNQDKNTRGLELFPDSAGGKPHDLLENSKKKEIESSSLATENIYAQEKEIIEAKTECGEAEDLPHLSESADADARESLEIQGNPHAMPEELNSKSSDDADALDRECAVPVDPTSEVLPLEGPVSGIRSSSPSHQTDRTSQEARTRPRGRKLISVGAAVTTLVVIWILVPEKRSDSAVRTLPDDWQVPNSASSVATAKDKPEINSAVKTSLVTVPPLDQGHAGESVDVKLPKDVMITFQYCPPGSFIMGSPKTEEGRSDDEDPVSVNITKGFWLARTEITHRQWEVVMGSDPSDFIGASDLPVDKIDWHDVQAFLKRLNRAGGLPPGWKWSLPTEAQWEYACRAGTATAYTFGNSPSTLAKHANFADKNFTLDDRGDISQDDGAGDQANVVGSYAANDWGLHDMHGNMWEWCEDRYEAKMAGGSDPLRLSGDGIVCRGGSWASPPDRSRAASRLRIEEYSDEDYIGFRPALVFTK
jgi:formylglycine-generating enzyme required for sulfatase activity